MIPLHDLGREQLPAISAWPAALEAEEPLGSLALPCASWDPNTAKAFVSVVIYHRPAALAVGLHAIASAAVDVKLGKQLRLAAARATFH